MARIGFLGVFALIGISLGVAGVRGAYLASVSNGWPTVAATVLESDTNTSRSGARGSRASTYSPDVVYEYTVNGERFESDRIYFAGVKWSSDSDYAQDFVRQFKAGSTVTASYDPKRPARAVLLPGIRRETWLTFLLSVVFTAFGLGGIWLTRDG